MTSTSQDGMNRTVDAPEDGEDDGASNDIDVIQAEIEHTREQLGQTVDALAAKLDVKARTRQRLDAGKRQAAARLDETRSQALHLTAATRAKVTDEHGDVRREAVVAAVVASLSLGVLAVVTRRRAA